MMLKIVARSRNKKTGPIPVTSRGQDTCPTTCPFFNNGCYGENSGGNPSTLFELAEQGMSAHDVDSLAAAMRQSGRPSKGQRRQLPIMRDREVGDVLHPDTGEVDRAYLRMVTDAARRVERVPFGYTHASQVTADDVPDGYVMNASCETPAGVADARLRGLPAVIVGTRAVLEQADPSSRYASCPAEERDVTCAECGLCAKPSRMADPVAAPVIVFKPHGVKVRKVRAAVAEAMGGERHASVV